LGGILLLDTILVANQSLGFRSLADGHNYISLVERGRTAPALDWIAAIARALQRKPSQLVRAAEKMTAVG
jgi:hypothetical protein